MIGRRSLNGAKYSALRSGQPLRATSTPLKPQEPLTRAQVTGQKVPASRAHLARKSPAIAFDLVSQPAPRSIDRRQFLTKGDHLAGS